ncbi:hypothetical protein PoB_006164800 [Plakobranchus ocellatus]|uniref:Uncharacterized protein n=1 Tax=Plakobranchus ocellatus TaxID=259542 RepID=A0AAV4CT72_9GAST|nr:hypothetical protein PoB_006164800 [Plakobranchus ocellatus]
MNCAELLCDKQADKIRHFANKNDIKSIYDNNLKEVHGSTTWSTSPLRNAHGQRGVGNFSRSSPWVNTVITEEKKTLGRWTEKFGDGLKANPLLTKRPSIDFLKFRYMRLWLPPLVWNLFKMQYLNCPNSNGPCSGAITA